MLGGDADPGVCDGDRDPATIDACPDLHPAAGRRVLERVFQEEDLADPIRVGQHLRKPGRDIDRQGHFLVIELRAEPRGRSLHEIPGPDAARVHGHEAGLGAGQFLQVIHEPLEAYGLSADQVERLGLRRDHAMHEAFYVTGDARQRRPSFMRYVRHEIPARGFCLLERSGHLVEVRGELSEFFGREYRDPLARAIALTMRRVTKRLTASAVRTAAIAATASAVAIAPSTLSKSATSSSGCSPNYN